MMFHPTAASTRRLRALVNGNIRLKSRRPGRFGL